MTEGKKPGRPTGGRARTRPEATVFGHAVAAIGMTHDEAASYLGVSVQSIRYYSTGARHVPDEVMERISTLWEQVSFRADPGFLPYAAAKRREALQSLRTRGWKRKTVPPADPPYPDEVDGLE